MGQPGTVCPSGGLPSQPGTLVGREGEQQALRSALLRDNLRLLTLWGPPGIGKTRLALAVAADVAAVFADGVVFVDLSLVAEPSAVLPAIAEALGVAGAERTLDGILAQLRTAWVLLLLDNLEHVLAMAADLALLLVRCPGLKILVTSRAALRLRWEHAFAVGPLAVPLPPFPPDAGTAAHYAGIAMFVERAAAARRDFRLTDANASTVAEVCARLEGVPLALELAASRIEGLPLRVLLARLQANRLQVLCGGAPDLPPRQQALRRALAWSYELLEPSHQALFRRLGVFEDGCTPEAAEAVCADAQAHGDVLEGLAALVHASLLRLDEPPDGQPRYSMLGTVRDYARERLADNPTELAEARRRCAAYAARSAVGSRHVPPLVLVNGTLEELTRREREVINLAVCGWSNRRIARELVISERTAEGHIHNILGKLQLQSRSQLAAWGARVGLLRSDARTLLLAQH